MQITTVYRHLQTGLLYTLALDQTVQKNLLAEPYNHTKELANPKRYEFIAVDCINNSTTVTNTIVDFKIYPEE